MPPFLLARAKAIATQDVLLVELLIKVDTLVVSHHEGQGRLGQELAYQVGNTKLEVSVSPCHNICGGACKIFVGTRGGCCTIINNEYNVLHVPVKRPPHSMFSPGLVLDAIVAAACSEKKLNPMVLIKSCSYIKRLGDS